MKQHPSQGQSVLTFTYAGGRMIFQPLLEANAPTIFQRFSYHLSNEFIQKFWPIWKKFYTHEEQNHKEEKTLSLRDYTMIYMFSDNNFDKTSVLNTRIKKTEALMKISTPNSYHFGRFLVEYTEGNHLFFEKEKHETKGMPRHADIEYKNGNLTITFADWTLDKEFKRIANNYQFDNKH